MGINQDISKILHEMKTPISIISGYAQIAQQCGIKDEILLNQALSSIISETNNILWLINSLQMPYLIKENNGEAVCVSDLVKECMEEYEVINPNREWKKHCEDRVYVQMNRRALKEIIRNLIDNAIKYSEERKAIQVGVFQINCNAVLSIKDNGIGIPSSEISRVFDICYRAQNVGNIKGSGLGLHYVNFIVSNYNGKIEVRSELGEGTEFLVYLPCVNQ